MENSDLANFNGENDGISFLYRTMLSRDPKKRKIKPVADQIIQVAEFDDSEDDSDFELGEAEFKGNYSSSDEESDVSESSSSSSESSENSNDEEASAGGEAIGSTYSSSIDTLKGIETVTVEEGMAVINTTTAANTLKVLICSVCLSTSSNETDEIMECDNCGITVHEGCYGTPDTESVASNESDSSTEPWFCDSCKANIPDPDCELCPNKGSIFKETETGGWVHIVCALYIPNVTFGDVEKLEPVNLNEIPLNKWGSKQCCYCEDSRFVRTGVCISCDAGMCKTYFHVTCAQRYGLLSEASPDEDIADPFYAYCKIHGDKFVMKQKSRNYLAIISHTKQFKVKHNPEKNERIQKKLSYHRNMHEKAKNSRTVLAPAKKTPKFLTANPSAFKNLIRKAELLGYDTEAALLKESSANGRLYHDDGLGPLNRKQLHIPPAFSTDYISYFLERNTRLQLLKRQVKQLRAQKKNLESEEKKLRPHYEQLTANLSSLNSKWDKNRKSALDFWNIINKLSDKKHTLPKILSSPNRSKSKLSLRSPPPPLIKRCGICEKSHNQQLLVLCDKCKKHYHLACLDPPLTRMPKKTAKFEWHCSECADVDSDDSSESMAAPSVTDDDGGNGTRRTKRQIREPIKFYSQLFALEGLQRLKRKKKRGGGTAKKKLATLVNEKSPEKEEKMDNKSLNDDVIVQPKEPDPLDMKKRRKEEGSEAKCACCSQIDSNKTLVKCDECHQCYHFRCLDPPRKNSPKQRGFAWYCQECDNHSSTSSSASEDDIKDVAVSDHGRD